MTELEKAVRAVHSHLSVALSDNPRANVPIATSILREWYDALGAALEAEAGWGQVDTIKIGTGSGSGYEYRMQRRPLREGGSNEA